MENTLENKAKFFALYLYCPYFFTDILGETNLKKSFDPMLFYRVIGCRDTLTLYEAKTCLQLRPLESLDQTECLYIADIFDLTEEAIRDTDLLEWIEALFTESAGYNIDGYTATEVQKLVDYLRSIGILIPFMGLSVETILQYGWARIEAAKVVEPIKYTNEEYLDLHGHDDTKHLKKEISCGDYQRLSKGDQMRYIRFCGADTVYYILNN